MNDDPVERTTVAVAVGACAVAGAVVLGFLGLIAWAAIRITLHFT